MGGQNVRVMALAGTATGAKAPAEHSHFPQDIRHKHKTKRIGTGKKNKALAVGAQCR